MKNFILVLSLVFSSIAFGSNTSNEEKLATIEMAKTQLTILKKQISEVEANLNKKLPDNEKAVLTKHLDKLKTRFNSAKLNLISTITEIKIEEEAPIENKKRDFIQEAESLVGPALDTIQRISARPRKIEKIKNDINYYEERLQVINQSLAHLDLLNTSEDFTLLKKDFETTIEESRYQLNEAKNATLVKLESLKFHLEDLTKDKVSLVQASTGLIKSFLATKGKNILVAMSIFIFTLWILFKFREKVIFRFLEKRPDEWYVKPVSAFYGFITILSALALSLVSLYLLGDWVLVTITILILSAALWTSKTYIPKYLTEFKLILNFGTIKEGELVVYAGLPWKVKSIGFVTIFENEFLDSKQIRIQISEISKMHSRKILPQEQWFPTKTNDWVLLNDGTFGKITQQTLEQITIQIDKTSFKYYQASTFLSLNPNNLSKGFTVNQYWGFDYQDQKILLTTILPDLNLYLIKSFTENGITPLDIKAHFHSAQDNSLNIVVWVDLPGEYASRRFFIQRILNQFLLQFCTEKQYNIPYPQLAVHLNQIPSDSRQ